MGPGAFFLAQAGANAFGNWINQGSVSSANNFNERMTQHQMNWTEQMANSAHQRQVKDLQAAGLNPTLSAGGNGAPTPSGAAASAVTPPQISMPDILGYGISLKQLEQADEKIAIDKANSAAAISKSLSETDLNKMRKVLYQKGMPRAQLEGEASSVLGNIIKYLKDSVRKQTSPQNIPPQEFEWPSTPNMP